MYIWEGNICLLGTGILLSSIIKEKHILSTFWRILLKKLFVVKSWNMFHYWKDNCLIYSNNITFCRKYEYLCREHHSKMSRFFIMISFQFNQFESRRDCTCVNHEFIFFCSGQKSFRMYILHTLISSLKILPVLSQKYVMSPFRDFRESQNPALVLLHYY